MAKKKPTGHIFSEKTRKRNAKIETAEYFEEHVLPKILDKSDVRNLTQSEIRGMKKFLKKRQDIIKTRIALVQDNPESLEIFESASKAAEEHIDTKTFSNKPEKLFQDYMRQEQFFNEYETDYDMWENRQEIRTHIEQMSQETADEAGEILGIDPNDKWTILRRLATQNNRINLDRAYASEVLKEIEDRIESGDYADIDELTADMLESYSAMTRANSEWNLGLRSFEDRILTANQGFHGKEKAFEKWSRTVKNSMSNYEPVWSSPFNIHERDRDAFAGSAF